LVCAAEAAKEFEKHKLSGWVTVRQRNIEERGFPCGAEGEEEGMIDLTGKADAVFLDLPAPHKVGSVVAAGRSPNAWQQWWASGLPKQGHPSQIRKQMSLSGRPVHRAEHNM
jgi:hypothetical protein